MLRTAQQWHIGALVVVLTMTTMLYDGTVRGRQGSAPSMGQEYQAALTLIETQGDCGAALKLLTRVSGGTDRALAALAWLMIGDCHERLGRATAHEAYRRVIEQFSDQTSIAQQAAKRLQALDLDRARALPPSRTVRELWAVGDGGRDRVLGLAADGQTIAKIDSDRNLELKSLRTGKSQVVATRDGGRISYGAAIAPNQSAVLFTRTESSGQLGLRVSRPTPKDSRLLYIGAPEELVRVHEWRTPETGLISLKLPSGRTRIALVDLPAGTVKEVLKIDGVPSNVTMSTSRRTVVFDQPVSPDGRRNLFMGDLETGVIAPFLPSRFDDAFASFASDGKRIFFVSDRSGGAALVTTQIGGDGSVAEPSIVERDLGPSIQLLGAGGEDSKIVFAMWSGSAEIQVLRLNPDQQRIDWIRPLTAPTVGFHTEPVVSPDGDKVAFRTNMKVGGRQIIGVYSIHDDSVRTIRTNLAAFAGPNWSPDGRGIAVFGQNPEYVTGYHLLDPETGASTPLLRAVIARISPSGKDVYGIREGARCVLIRHVLASGMEQTFAFNECERMKGAITDFDITRDGLMAVQYVSGNDWKIVLVWPDGRHEDLFQTRRIEALDGLTWSPDNRSLLTVRRVDGAWGLWRLHLDGGLPSFVGALPDGVTQSNISRDGRTVAFQIGDLQIRSYILEHALLLRR